jgi:prepilin signal peptidase PulO-like enzyme (type II secretory pathway)
LSDVYTVVRLADIVLYLLIIAGFWRHRETFLTANRRLRMLLVGLGLLVLTGLYSVLEVIALDVPGGPRTLITPVPLIFLAISLHLDFVLHLFGGKRHENRG